MSEGPPDATRFTDVDWDRFETSGWTRPRVSVPSLVTAALLVGTCALFLYDAALVPPDAATFSFWDVSRVDWLTLIAGAIAVGYGVVPAVRSPDRARSFVQSYPRRPIAVVSFLYVCALLFVGLLGPVVFSPPALDFTVARQPPAFTSVSTDYVVQCVGPVAGDHCRGTLETPLGTTRAGESVLVWLVYGTRTVLQFALISAILMVPVATFLGVTAAAYGGWIGGVLMRVAELQEAVPTFLIYFVMFVFVDTSLFVLILAYGLFNWGGVAQVVYSAALSETNRPYVRAVRSAGGDNPYLIRRHLVPNVGRTVVTEATLLLPKLILLEVLFSFLGLGGDASFSWGQLVQRGLRFDPTQVQGGFSTDLRGIGIGELGGLWWITFLPIVAVVVTVFLITVFGDAVQETFERRAR